MVEDVSVLWAVKLIGLFVPEDVRDIRDEEDRGV